MIMESDLHAHRERQSVQHFSRLAEQLEKHEKGGTNKLMQGSHLRLGSVSVGRKEKG